MTPLDEAKRLNTPPLQGRGRGWGLSANAIARNQSHARDMRNDPTEPEKRLWLRLRASQLAGFKFRRQATIGHYIVDFLCPATGLIVEVDGDTHSDTAADKRRDETLAVLGHRVVRFTNEDVMRNIEGVLEHLLTALTVSPSLSGEGPGVGPHHQAWRLRLTPTPTPPLKGKGLSGPSRRSCWGLALRGSVG